MTNRPLSGLLFALPALALPVASSAAQCSALLSHPVNYILGTREDLCQYAGKVVLV